MKMWKRNLVIAAVMLFVCAGVYLNWLQGKNTPTLTETLNADLVMGEDTLVMNTEDMAEAAMTEASMEVLDSATAEENFARIRLARQQARDSAVELLQEAMSYEEPGSTTEASMQLTNLVSDALAEAQIESLVVAKGYTDCVAYMADGIISVAVSAPAEGLQQTDVAVISDIVTAQTDYDLTDLRIIEVK